MKKEMEVSMKVKAVYTDTYNGEANFSWSREVIFETNNLTQRALIRKAKALHGVTVRHTLEWNNNGEIMIKFNRCNLCMFIEVL